MTGHRIKTMEIHDKFNWKAEFKYEKASPNILPRILLSKQKRFRLRSHYFVMIL